MNIAVCDKSPADREIITDFLHHYFSDKSIQYKISEFESGANLVYEFEDSKNFDVVFLDAYVGELLGIESFTTAVILFSLPKVLNMRLRATR